MLRPRFITVAVLAGAVVLLSPALARASCAPPAPLRGAIKDAPSVFVGEVVDVSNRTRWATVEVERVWKGPDLPSEVEVRAGPADPPGLISSASSVDRTFTAGFAYLFVPYKAEGSVFRDNACTRTTRFRFQHERLGKALFGVSSIEPERHAPAGSLPLVLPWIAAAGCLIAFFGTAWLLARRWVRFE